jgi:DNA-binding CsgD family transcriptional regulator
VSADLDVRGYARDLAEHLQVMIFGGRPAAYPEAVVLLVRGALADGDRGKGTRLAGAIAALADGTPGDSELAAAAAHARGLVDRDPAVLEQAARRYSACQRRAAATEDAGVAAAAHGDQDRAAATLRRAYAQYEELGSAEAMARVRSHLRAGGVRLPHWKRADRPASGWDSLTETEHRVVGLVAQGLSNRQVAGRMFLSTHTVAFHLRHIFWKLNLGSRVELARMAALRDRTPPASAAS